MRGLLKRYFFSLKFTALLLFTVLALAWPVVVISSVVIIVGSYVLIDGIISLALAIKKRKTHMDWDQQFMSGLFGIFAGILTFFNPFILAGIIIFLLFY